MIIRGLFLLFQIALIFLLCLPDLRGEDHKGNHIIDSLIQIALENNPEILSGRYMHQSAEYKAKSAGAVPDPKFTIAALNLPRSSLSLNETPMSGIALGLSQTIPWPGGLKAKKAVAQLQSDNKKQDIRRRENNIIRMVKHYYYDYSYWVKAKLVVDANIELIQFNTNIAETKYANGAGSKQDVLRSYTTMARLENKKLMMAQMSRTALLHLGRLLDDTSIVHANLPAYLPEELDSRGKVMELNNPNLIKAGIRKSISDKKLSLAKSGYYPNFTLGVDYRIRKDLPMDAVRGEDFISIKAGFQLPLWFFTKQKNETKSARLALKASEENYRSMRNMLKQEISAVQLAMTTLAESLEQYNNNIIHQARAAYDAARTSYEVGEIDFNDLLSAQLDLLEIELERAELLKNYWQKYAEYSELSGE